MSTEPLPPIVAAFTRAFDEQFLRDRRHYELVSSAALGTLCYHADPTAFFVRFLRESFGESSRLVQLDDDFDMLYPMCTAYYDVENLKLEFNIMNQFILADAIECCTVEQLIGKLKWAVTKLYSMKLTAWNIDIRSAFLFQVTRSDTNNLYYTDRQDNKTHLRMSVDDEHRSVSFYHNKVKAAFSIENIQYRGVVTTSTTNVTMVEFSGSWWHCNLDRPRKGTRRPALFRIRGKLRDTQRQSEQSSDLNHYALIDLFGNHLDCRRL